MMRGEGGMAWPRQALAMAVRRYKQQSHCHGSALARLNGDYRRRIEERP